MPGMAPPKLAHLFGLKGEVKGSVQYAEETEVVYPAGRQVVMYSLERKTQRFVGGDALSGEKDAQITAVALHSGKHKVMAVAEKGERATVSVVDLASGKKRTKVPLSCPDMISKEFISLSFSPDGKQLLAQGGAPDWTLVNFLWEKGKPLQAAQVSNQSGAAVHQCSYCPTDPTCVCVSGNGILRFLRLEQAEFKSIQFTIGKREQQNYLCHAWVEDRILVGTDTGDILVFDNAEFRGVLETSPSNGKSIDSIATYSKGFVCGCEEGVLYVFERDDREIYKETKSFQIDGNYVRIKNLSVSPSEDNVVCALENNQAFVLSLSNTDILKAEEMNFEPLSVPFHFSRITGLDTCVRKPLVVTCGVDRSVRVWNYVERSLEVVQFFNEEPHSVAFHPSGLHLLVGFSDSLRLMNLLLDDMNTLKEFPVKSCTEVRFSNGGQYFAAANGSTVQLFSTYTCENVGVLRGHKARITSLLWVKGDAGIVTTSADGQMLEWQLKEGRATQEYRALPAGGSDGRVQVLASAAAPDGVVYLATSDRALRSVQGSSERARVEVADAVTQLGLARAGAGGTTGAGDGLALFAGTEHGSLVVYPLPLAGEAAGPGALAAAPRPDPVAVDCHGAAITRVRISPDGSHIFTASADGCLAIFASESGAPGPRGGAHGAAGAGVAAGGGPGGVSGDPPLAWAEEILVTKSELEDIVSTMNELRNKVEELHYHNQMQLKLREMNYQDKLREVTEKFHHELEADKERYQSLEDAKSDMEKRYQQTMEDLQRRQATKLDELEQHHAHKVETEARRYRNLQEQLEKVRRRWKEQRERREGVYDKELDRLRGEFDDTLEGRRSSRAELEEETAKVVAEFEETKRLLEEEADREIDELKANYDSKLTLERMNTLRLKDENAILKVKFGALRDDIEERKESIRKRNEKQRMLYDEIHALEKDVDGHIKEIQERDSTIGDKVKRIFELRKKNQELEKFKFVLDYKIKELKRQIMPRQRDIRDMSEQIGQMDQELGGYRTSNAHLQLELRELRLKLNGMEAELEERKAGRRRVLELLRRVRGDISEATRNLEDTKALKTGLKGVYHAHVAAAAGGGPNSPTAQAAAAAAAAQAAAAAGGDGEGGPPGAGGEGAGESGQSPSDVHMRQRYYLERSVDSLKKKMKKDAVVAKKDSMRIMQENIALVKEINQLRREMQLIRGEAPPPALAAPGDAESSRWSRPSTAAFDASTAPPSTAATAAGATAAEGAQIEKNKREIERLAARLSSLQAMRAGAEGGAA